MAFRPIDLPPDTPPIVQALIRDAVQPFLVDVHAMFRLPTDDSLEHVGCNLSIAQVLLASIGGISAVLYSTTGGTGAAFRDFLTNCYPWDTEPARDNAITGTEAATILYDEYRNPLTHSSGTPVYRVDRGARREYRPARRGVQINRLNLQMDGRPDRGLTEQRISELESEPARPVWLRDTATLKILDNRTVLTVEALYWGLRASVQRLCASRERMEAAVQFFRP